jgi:tRNA(Ile)-lysidine synthase
MASSKNLKAKQLIEDYPDNSGYLIAYSGGADSSALLHLFATSNGLIGKVRAIHINHGINPKAQQWQNHCQQTCEDFGIPIVCINVQLKDESENSCRVARYDSFKDQLKDNEILLTGHHNQDQAETVLMKLVRGSGIKGLAGIERIKRFENGWIARPLLSYSPESLKEYLKHHQLNWIEDDSNQDNEYRRNHIRNNTIPDLQHHWPKALDNIARSAANLQNSMQLLRYFTNSESKSLAISKLLELPVSLRASFLYQWLADKNLPLPNKVAIEQITEDFIQAETNKNPKFKIKQYTLQRWNNRIYCLRNIKAIDSLQEFIWVTNSDFELPNKAGTLKYNGNDSIELTIKFNQQGQKLKPYNQAITKSVKNLFQEQQIPTWQRQWIPYIYHKDELVSIGFDLGTTLEFKDKLELVLNDLEL